MNTQHTVVTALALALVACGGPVFEVGTQTGSETQADAGTDVAPAEADPVDAAAPPDVMPDAHVGVQHDGGGPDAAIDAPAGVVLVDAEADAGSVDPPPACDPLDPNACGTGKGCAGTCVCLAAQCIVMGTGRQGAPCGSTSAWCGTENCAAGFECVTGGGLQAQCAAWCDLATATGCPEGTTCSGDPFSCYATLPGGRGLCYP